MSKTGKYLKLIHRLSQDLSIGFAEYLAEHAQPLAPNKGRWITYDGKVEKTTKQLYNDFIESLT